ncbi:dihydropteroate synthase [Puniceibacterium sp. IMCC21224]|uniref:dihydropteroate synthase n=1 Tax=Puniceibacterium sp. IMCC21224 TaxID=1618204 RepID=UPI00064D73EE|nr:dihydropteroate synthase [Puniceibacterium sp. IMCC21224]KMK66896.1 dihydropteroate synthase [Puniceibacterium sp. IMCC21224]
MSEYFRPLVRNDFPRPTEALCIAGGTGWFTHAELLRRDGHSERVDIDAIPGPVRDALSRPRGPILGMSLDQPRIMGILNVTPDSFSDGGHNIGPTRATTRGLQMVEDGVDIIDVGGESTRPGAQPVPVEAEIARIEPVITALGHTLNAPISIDTRKVSVADAAIKAGAAMVNDISGFTYDRMLAPYCARLELPVCVMHALGDPETMQENPRYDNVLLDVYDFLAAQVVMLEQSGIPRSRIIVDPGIGFGKALQHNLAILNGISLFHGLGCPILIGASRKGFIGRIASVPEARKRAPGSIAVALAAVAQGVQILRVHDVAETRQALALWCAVQHGERYGA